MLIKEEAITIKGSILSALYDKYIKEMNRFDFFAHMTLDCFKTYLDGKLPELQAVTAYMEDRICGCLLYKYDAENACCILPVYGYFAEDEGTLGRLFAYLADKLVAKGDCKFSVHLYAHDDAAIRLYSMMQFGMMSEKCIRRIPDYEQALSGEYTLSTLSKEEIMEKWAEVWGLTKAIVDHLKSSPVFYPGEEFTEEVYREFFLDGSTAVHAAFDSNGNMVGIIESNQSPELFLCPYSKSVNVGEVYVVPSLRGTGLAKELLHYAENYERKGGAELSWVEHGTANPNARGFWNKYFNTWQYEMVRDIKRIGRNNSKQKH